MKAYICDSCGVTIKDPYTAKMREYYGDNYEGEFWRRRIKVQLCKLCYDTLRSIGKKKAEATR